MMATSEPSEDAIENFVSFTSTSRDTAISFLKANNLDSQKAINAYFEDPTPPQQFQIAPSFKIEHADSAPGQLYSIPPSRPPSRIDVQNSDQPPKYEEAFGQNEAGTSGHGLSLAEREERELQQAMAMSLDQNLGAQGSGVTSSTSAANFTKATRDHYEESDWAMTLFHASSREIVISPDPQDRQRVPGEPAFLRPCEDFMHLGGLLTVLHSIPLAREALLLRGSLLPSYGHDPQWWNGQPINVPKIVTVQDAQADRADWDDILHETQRLMAFLDGTTRAFGSVDALASLKSLTSYDSEGNIGRFLETWQEAAVRATPENRLATIFSSRALKRPLLVHDTPIEKIFCTLDPYVEASRGQTLYDVLDGAMWSDRAGEELDDVWLDHVADVLTIRLDNSQPTATSVDVEIPAVFYADRYLDRCRETCRKFRAERLKVYEQLAKLHRLMNRFAVSETAVAHGLNSRDILEKAAVATSLALPRDIASDVTEASMDVETASTAAMRLANELRAISDKIDAKLKELEAREQTCRQSLQKYSKILTEPTSEDTEEGPSCKYTLRGVCTEPHVVYVLRRATPENSTASAEINEKSTSDSWQWWRISFSTEDAKARRAENGGDGHHHPAGAPPDADVVGYTARQVQEVDVLRAAREESKNVLLVYASRNAIDAPEAPAPAQLQEFVRTDNQSFQKDLEQAQQARTSEQAQEVRNWETEAGLVGESTAVGMGGQFHGSEPSTKNDPVVDKDTTGSSGVAGQKVNVFDFEVPSFEGEEGNGSSAKEMTERAGSGLFRRSAGPMDVSHPAEEEDEGTG